jgi:hypothetical protein
MTMATSTSTITVETTGTDPEQQADALAQALLVQVREMAASRPGIYTISARLNENGSWTWKWDWFPASEKRGERAGSEISVVQS